MNVFDGMSCGWMWPNVDIDCGYDDSFVAVAVVCGCGWSVNMFDGMNDLWLDGVECGHRPMGMGMMILCWCCCCLWLWRVCVCV